MIAYIDGTTGGMMVQIITASIVGGFVAFKLIARNFVSSFFGRFRTESTEHNDSAVGEEVDQSS